MSSVTPEGRVRIQRQNEETKIIQYAKIGNKPIKITVDHNDSISLEDARTKISKAIGRLEEYLQLHSHDDLKSGKTFKAADEELAFHVIHEERRNPLKGDEYKVKSTFFKICTLNLGHSLKSSTWTALLSEWKTTTGSIPRFTVKPVNTVLQENKDKLTGLHPVNFIEAYQKYTDRQTSPIIDPIWYRVKKELGEMNATGKCVIFSPLTGYHHMVCMAEMQADGQIKFYVFNAGLGIQHHGDILRGDEGGFISPRALVYENIPMENVKSFLNKLAAFHTVSPATGPKGTVAGCYHLIRKMGGDKVEDLPEEKFWGRFQLKGSCTGQAEMALLQAVLPKDKLDLVTQQLKKHAAFKMYDAIVRGKAFKTSQKMNTLDFVNELLNGKLNENLKAKERESLLEIKANLEAVLPGARFSKLPIFLRYSVKQYAEVAAGYQSINSNGFEHAVKSASYYYTMGNYAEVRKILGEIFENASSIPDDKKEEVLKLLKKLNKIQTKIGDKSKEAIDLKFGTFFIMNKIEKDFIENDKSLKKNFLSVRKYYLHLSVSREAKTPWSEIYNKYLDQHFGDRAVPNKDTGDSRVLFDLLSS